MDKIFSASRTDKWLTDGKYKDLLWRKQERENKLLPNWAMDMKSRFTEKKIQKVKMYEETLKFTTN